MNQTEFMDLLRYYFRRVTPDELAEILSDYEAHFEEGKKAGLSEEDICRELGSPRAVYEMYLHEEMIHETEEDPLTTPAPKPGGQKSRLTGQAGRIAGQAGRIADATLSRAQKTWEEDIGPRVPAATDRVGSLAWKILFSACYASGFLIILITLLLVYLLSGTVPPFGGFSPLPGLSFLTLFCLAGTGIFAGLALIFAGAEIRRAFLSRQAPPSSGLPAGPASPTEESPAEPDPSETIRPIVLLPAADRK